MIKERHCFKLEEIFKNRHDHHGFNEVQGWCQISHLKGDNSKGVHECTENKFKCICAICFGTHRS